MVFVWRHRVRDKNFAQRGVAELCASAFHKHTVRSGNRDFRAGARFDQCLNRPGDRATGRNHVVNDQARPITHLANQPNDSRLRAALTVLVQHGGGKPEHLCVLTTVPGCNRRFSSSQSVGTAVRWSTGR